MFLVDQLEEKQVFDGPIRKQQWFQKAPGLKKPSGFKSSSLCLSLSLCLCLSVSVSLSLRISDQNANP